MADRNTTPDENIMDDAENVLDVENTEIDDAVTDAPTEERPFEQVDGDDGSGI